MTVILPNILWKYTHNPFLGPALFYPKTKTMFKSKVPFCIFSVVLLMTAATSANPGTEPGKNVRAAAGRTRSIRKKKTSMTLPEKREMKFVHSYIRNNNECLN